MVMSYVVYGKVWLGKSQRPFKKEVEAPSEKMAKEKVLSLFGSHNGVKRSKIVIERVEKNG